MNIIEIVLIGIGLSMDACCVSVSNGICAKNLKARHVMANSVFFGVFQGIMPIIGFYAGSLFVSVLSEYSPWVVFIVFAILGGKMIYDTLNDNDGESRCIQMSAKLLMLQAIATSIDALAVGVVFSAMKVDIFFASGLISIITFILSFAAIILGKKIGSIFNKKAAMLGGILLLIIAGKTLLDTIL